MKQITDAFSQRLKSSGVTRIQWIASYYLGVHKSLSQRELAVLMNVKDSSIGRLLDRMERDNIIIRHRSDKDRRIIHVSLTKHGEELQEQLIPLGVEFNNELIKGLSDNELRIFDNVMQKMLHNVTTIEKV